MHKDIDAFLIISQLEIAFLKSATKDQIRFCMCLKVTIYAPELGRLMLFHCLYCSLCTLSAEESNDFIRNFEQVIVNLSVIAPDSQYCCRFV